MDRLRCMHNAARSDFLQQLNQYWGPAYAVEFLNVSQTRQERRGVCIWTIYMYRVDGLDIGDAEYAALERRIRREYAPGSQFLSYGRYTGEHRGVKVRYYPYDCHCTAGAMNEDFRAARTRFGLEPRNCTYVSFHIPNILQIIRMLDGHDQMDNIIVQLIQHMIDIKDKSNQFINLNFIIDDEDDNKTYSVNVKTSKLIATIKQALQSQINIGIII